MPWPLRLLAVLLLIMFLVLQYRLWVGQGSLAEVNHLEHQVRQQQAQIAKMQERNALLRVEVESLKTGLDAVEARAREDLGMIKKGEIFYQVVPAEGKR